MDLFDLASYGVLPKNEKTLLFEGFSGIGTQSMAYDILHELIGIDFEIVGFSEIDPHAIKSYYAIRQDNTIKNYGDIAKIEQLPYCHVCTWSFPCQSISLAGKQEGMVEGTKSNYGYKFLETVQRSEHKPKVLIMENVKALASETFDEDFKNIQNILKNMGYENHWKVLNSKHYGVAQNRERVFMISILGGGWFQFPPKVKLTKRLKDYLEDEVSEKYYLSAKTIENTFLNYHGNNKKNGFKRDKIFINNVNRKDISQTITTKMDRAESQYVTEPFDFTIIDLKSSNHFKGKPNSEIAPTQYAQEHYGIIIPEATKQGYALAEDGDGVYINRPHQKRGVVQKGMIQTIKTQCNDIGVVVEHKNVVEAYNNFIDKNGYIPEFFNPYNNSEIKDISPTITTMCDRWQSSSTIAITNNLRIRKLTPLECWRLMGIKDEYFWRAKNAGVSDSQLYKQAGNAIVVDVLVAIFKNLYK